MRDGEIQQIGTPQEVFDHPANLFVAGFIGMPQMNFYDAKLVKDGAAYAVELENAHIVLSDEKQTNLAASNVAPQAITLGVRPEHIALMGDGAQMIHGTVDVSEMMGSAVHLHDDGQCRRPLVAQILVELVKQGDAQHLGAVSAHQVRRGERAHIGHKHEGGSNHHILIGQRQNHGGGPFFGGEIDNGLAVDQDVAGRHIQKAADGAQDGRLSAAGGPQHGHDFAFVNIKADVFDTVAVVVLLCHVADL